MTSFDVAAPLVVPDDVLITPVRSLSPGLRRQLEGDLSDYAITRPRARTPSRIVDEMTAQLLHEFRIGTPIVEAVLNFSRANGTDPEDTLEAAFPALQRLINDGLLVPATSDAARAIEATLKAGDHLGDLEIIEVVQTLVDVEVSRARSQGLGEIALKIARSTTSDARTLIRREAAILDVLGGESAPRLEATGEIAGRPYVAMEWLDGRDVVSWARAGEVGDDEMRVVVAAQRLADAYASLHDRRVLHGDVHPRNALVLTDGSVRLIDFGLADSESIPRALRPRQRGGVGYFLEPELARARLDGEPPPRVTPVGEQYSVAALLYLVLTGAHYLRFSPEKDVMRRQIVEDAPLSFAEVGAAPQPLLEAALRTALGKEESQRFASTADFARAVRDAIARDGSARSRTRARISTPSITAATRLADGLIARAEAEGPATLAPPTASVTYGAAGTAYGLLRLARATGDPGLLAQADIWSQRAQTLATRIDAFTSAGLDIGPDTVGRSTPYHTVTGVHWVRAAVSQAMGDLVGFVEACGRVASASEQLSENPDLTLGRAGTLVGYASLLELARGLPLANASNTADIEVVAAALAGELTELLDQLGPVATESSIRFLGIAHGWAGIVYAILRWCEATGHPVPPPIPPRLDELAKLADRAGDGLRWPRLSPPHGRPDFVPSWCNGSAGFVHVFLSAAKLLGDAKYRSVAEGAALDAVGPAESGIDLCCGRAGRAYAGLAVFRATGDERWVLRARELVIDIAPRCRPSGPFALSLYKGALGLAVLLAELAAPSDASMPLFEAEGWPDAARAPGPS